MTIQPEQEMSIARRRVLIAGGAGALAPVLGFVASAAAAKPTTQSQLSNQHGDRFVLSGRIADAQDKPLSGQTIEVLGDGAALATTDGDGRFVLAMNVPAHLDHLFLKFGGNQTKRIELAGNTAKLARDGASVWRAAVAIAMA